jgi:N-methylhydantoinase B
MVVNKLNPVTFEIISHRLWLIPEEMSITMERVSGSPVVSESGDYTVGLFTDKGEPIATKPGGYGQVAGVGHAVEQIIRRYDENPGIFEGDVFLLNDPYVCAVHTSDVYIVSPIHYNGELVGWSGSFSHFPDIGGIAPAGMFLTSTSIFDEGIRFVGIKIAEKGQIKKDAFDSFIYQTRLPDLVGLDIRAGIAAGITAGKRLNNLVERYGIDTIRAAEDKLIKDSEIKLRSRLKELPDGIWHSQATYIDSDGRTDRIYKIVGSMIKNDDSLTLDFTGSSEQAPSAINCTFTGGEGRVMTMIGALLAHGIPINAGLTKPIKMIFPEGSVVNANFPAPCGMATWLTNYQIGKVVLDLLSKMLFSVEKYRQEICAGWLGAISNQRLTGIGRDGKPYAAVVLDEHAGGCGARPGSDGVDSGGAFTMSSAAILTNIENFERLYPVIYLFRRQCKDTGGPGKFRGGVGCDTAWIIHEVPKATWWLSGMGQEGMNSFPLFGGYPSNNNVFLLLRKSDVLERLKEANLPDSIEGYKGIVEKIPPFSKIEVSPEDILYCLWMGGGGYGDPLERDPKLVSNDIRNGLVSFECARDIYGVVINSKTSDVDLAGTKKQRDKIRSDRLRAK